MNLLLHIPDEANQYLNKNEMEEHYEPKVLHIQKTEQYNHYKRIQSATNLLKEVGG